MKREITIDGTDTKGIRVDISAYLPAELYDDMERAMRMAQGGVYEKSEAVRLCAYLAEITLGLPKGILEDAVFAKGDENQPPNPFAFNDSEKM